uniref:Protein NIM1-INTERACTING 1 n=1 Tax=Noccaea caerulescens TaxID=107243 RepID=A0A1J3IYC9_NOCCA
MAIMNKEKKIENNRINEIDDEELEDEESENKKMEMFFNLIRNYQEARKRRRQELTEEESGDAASDPRKRSDVGDKSGIVPAFRTEDFSHCIDLNSKPSNSVVPTKNQEDEKEEEEETEKEKREENDLDLNLAL